MGDHDYQDLFDNRLLAAIAVEDCENLRGQFCGCAIREVADDRNHARGRKIDAVQRRVGFERRQPAFELHEPNGRRGWVRLIRDGAMVGAGLGGRATLEFSPDGLAWTLVSEDISLLRREAASVRDQH